MIHDPAHGCCRLMARIEQQKTVDCRRVSPENNVDGLMTRQLDVLAADYRNCPSVRVSKPPCMVEIFALPDELDPTNVTPSLCRRCDRTPGSDSCVLNSFQGQASSRLAVFCLDCFPSLSARHPHHIRWVAYLLKVSFNIHLKVAE